MSDDDDSDEEMYSVRSSQTVYKRSRSRGTSVATSSEYRPVPKIVVRSDSDERYESVEYLPVQKWGVDYNNKNYVRSMCNKNTGRHRKVFGRPLDWQIDYDNSYFQRSKVNAPKGLHRKIPDVKRKYVPDDDDLADATGWEFDYGPEFDQLEQDVHFIPEGRIIRRGCYRWYGVKRNDSDCDVKLEEHRENLLNEELEEELKCGHEFLQSDVPHMSEQSERRYTRGGYRHYEVQRNAYDIDPEEMASAKHDPEWRRKHHSNGFRYLDMDMCKYDRDDLSDHYSVKRQGKPFKRTILNKVYELRKEVDEDEEDSMRGASTPGRRGTRLSLIPGEGEKTLYEGKAFPFQTKKAPSIRSVFKKKSEREKYTSTRDGDETEEYHRKEKEHRYTELGPKYQDRLHRMADQKRDSENRRKGGSERFHEYTYRVKADENEPPRRHSIASSTSSYRDVRANFEAWRDIATNTKREKETEYLPGERLIKRKEKYRDEEYISSDEEQDEPRKPPGIQRSHRGVKDKFDTWRDNVKSSREDENRNYQSKKSEEQKPVYRDRNLPTRENVVEKRSKLKDFDDRHSFKERNNTMKNNDHHDTYRKDTNRMRNKYDYSEQFDTKDDEKASNKLPPHVKERMEKIRQRMMKKFKSVNPKCTGKGDHEPFEICTSEESIDLMKHKKHPHDRGHEHNSGYEKYVAKNGSELWVKSEEKFSELHHKNRR